MFNDTDVLVVGTGYLGSRVAKLSRQNGSRVFATTRQLERLDAFARAGFQPIQFDWTNPITWDNFPTGQLSASPRVLIAVSYDRRSRHSRYESQVGGLRNLLNRLPEDARVVYISTTGVYHQTDGRWVDETSPSNPTRLGGRVHLQAEQVLHQQRPQSPWMILRLAGIYGPGRVPRAADVVAGRPIASPPEGYLNLIHVQDAAAAVLAAWERLKTLGTSLPIGIQSRLYNVADDHPVVRGEFYREIARQLGATPPRFVPPGENASDRMRSDSNKRVWNRKLRRELLPALEFPDYRRGLADVL